MEQILPPRLARRVAALQAMVVTTGPGKTAVDARLLSTIAGACRDHESLRFRYLDQVGAATSREVEPHRVVNAGRRWYLVAWDRTRQDWRTFRVDRIQPRATTGARFASRDPPAADLADYVFRGRWFAGRCRARVALLVPASTAAERLPFAAGLLEPVDRKSCVLEMHASTWEGIAMHVVLLGVDFRVDQPPELVEEIRRVGERYRRALSA